MALPLCPDAGTLPAREQTPPERPPNTVSWPPTLLLPHQEIVRVVPLQRKDHHNNQRKDHHNNNYCSLQGFANTVSILFNKSAKANVSTFVLQVGKLRHRAEITYSKLPAGKRQGKVSKLRWSMLRMGSSHSEHKFPSVGSSCVYRATGFVCRWCCVRQSGVPASKLQQRGLKPKPPAGLRMSPLTHSGIHSAHTSLLPHVLKRCGRPWGHRDKHRSHSHAFKWLS